MNVFIDYHHGDLYYSLYCLFFKRLGWNIYRPIGIDWFDDGFWKIAEPYGNARDTINQYLSINKDGYVPYVNLNGEHYVEDGVYHIYDPAHKYYQKAVTLEKFKSMKFDVIIPSIASHDGPYTRLRDLFQPQAKLIAHLGNGGQRTQIKNVIHSTPYTPTFEQNTVYVHQEIDPDLYRYVEPNPDTKNVFSMVNCLPYPNIYNQYKAAMPDVNFKAYGASCPDGALSGSKGVGAEMINANIGWQLKPLGGLGHTAMGWFASGRPVITNMSQNRKTGGDAMLLFEPGVTCLDIEAHSPEENYRLIREMLDDNLAWAERAHKRFKEVLNYDKEETDTRKFLERII